MTRSPSVAIAVALLIASAEARGEQAAEDPALARAAGEPAAALEAGGGEAGPAVPRPEPLPALVARLRSASAAERASAVRELGDRGDPEAVSPLVDLLRADSSAAVRGWAVRSLDQLGTAEARSAIAAAATADPDEQVRSLAARIAGLGVRRAEPPAPEPRPVEPPTEPPMQGRPPGQRLRLAGWCTFAASYGMALVAGTILMSFGGGEADLGWKLLLPVVGPAVAAATEPEDDWDEWERDDFRPAAITMWIWTGIEAVGLILVGVGYGQARAAARSAEQDGDVDASEAEGPTAGVVVGPGPGGEAGLSLAGWF
jgi:hypothetical protein